MLQDIIFFFANLKNISEIRKHNFFILVFELELLEKLLNWQTLLLLKYIHF